MDGGTGRLMLQIPYLTQTLHGFPHFATPDNGFRCPNSTLVSAAKFTSTSVPIVACGSAQPILRARTGASAPRKRASRKPRRSPRTGICSCAEDSAPEKSRETTSTRTTWLTASCVSRGGAVRTFDGPSAGTGAGQGTFPYGIRLGDQLPVIRREPPA